VRPVVALQDPCHLRHVQKAHLAVRTVLAPYADIVELDDEGLCCGAGGAYSAQQPELAGAIRERKVAAIGRTGAAVVASANPGCAYHLAGAGVVARHPLEIVDEGIRHGR
jgi:glycolate oxidase iron-sulfur subunit